MIGIRAVHLGVGVEPGQYGAVHVFTVDNGRINRFREYVDLDAAL